MDGSIKKRAAWGMLVLLLGAARLWPVNGTFPTDMSGPAVSLNPGPWPPVLFGTSSRSFWPTGNSGTGSPNGTVW